MDIRNHTPAEGNRMSGEQGRPERIKEYIRHNLSADLGADSVSEKFGLSISSLLHIFKKHERQTYRQYIEHARMQAAFDLIANRDKRVKEAMYATGYKVKSTFIALLKEHSDIHRVIFVSNCRKRYHFAGNATFFRLTSARTWMNFVMVKQRDSGIAAKELQKGGHK
ncbi:MAG: helix-turn-helix transcriptional regulator [Chitinophagaceae bacterium]|nr:helix-turn-helix transcriptional regulator [Chitinophagaceae bacterium]